MGKTATQKIPVASMNWEASLYDKGYRLLCGVDEVGRGPLAGPVVAAAVIVPCVVTLPAVDDSKKLTPARREELFDEIVETGLKLAIGIIDNEGIDHTNILKASLLAMRKAVMDLKVAPDIILVDGEYTIPKLGFPQYAIVGGDASCKAIAAASIIAKVTRDRIMDRYAVLYPAYGFDQHKGYPTAQHLDALKKHGPCEIHRRSFKPVADLVKEYVPA